MDDFLSKVKEKMYYVHNYEELVEVLCLYVNIIEDCYHFCKSYTFIVALIFVISHAGEMDL